jgi:hypothetical protein
LFVPDQPGTIVTSEQSQAQLGMYSPGNQSTAVELAPANYSFTTTQIADEQFVSKDQLMLAMNEATKRGAKEGEQRALASMRNKVSTRNRVGI